MGGAGDRQPDLPPVGAPAGRCEGNVAKMKGRKDFRGPWAGAFEEAHLGKQSFDDLKGARAADMAGSGVPEKAAMMIGDYWTGSVLDLETY